MQVDEAGLRVSEHSGVSCYAIPRRPQSQGGDPRIVMSLCQNARGASTPEIQLSEISRVSAESNQT